jgi:hypothetical protein
VNLEDAIHPSANLHLFYEHTYPGSEPCLQGTSIDFNNPNSQSYYFSRCYWNYWRILTPGGTELKGSSFVPVPKEYFRFEDTDWKNELETGPGENGTYVIGGLTVVPQLQEREIQLETDLPPTVIKEVENGRLVYTLRIQKQPGIISLPVEIFVTPPAGFILSEEQDEWISTSGNQQYFWAGDIEKTTDFQIVFNKVS